MKIHEYQAKEILRKFNVPVPEGFVAFSVDEAIEAAKKLPTEIAVVKAQIHAGGRGKGGGVKIAKNAAELKEYAEQILGMNLVTHQTGPEGKEVKKLLIEQGMDIDRELYLGMVLDRGNSRFAMMASTEGGMEIEKVAAETPEKILKVWVDPKVGLQAFQARQLAFGLGLEGKQVSSAVKFILSLYKAFMANDCSIAEINPLVVTKQGDVLALDAKINFDDSALYRHKDLLELRDLDEEEPLELEASKYDLNYIKLDGNVGCMVNGAGLAMATMDIIKLTGGEPLLRSDIIEIVQRISSIPGIRDVSITTNGFFLTQYAEQLKEAGLSRVNVSLDTLNPRKFKMITGVDAHENVNVSSNAQQPAYKTQEHSADRELPL